MRAPSARHERHPATGSSRRPRQRRARSGAAGHAPGSPCNDQRSHPRPARPARDCEDVADRVAGRASPTTVQRWHGARTPTRRPLARARRAGAGRRRAFRRSAKLASRARSGRSLGQPGGRNRLPRHGHRRSWSYIDAVIVRLLALLLALVVAAGVVSPALAAAADAVGQLDDSAPDPAPAIASQPVAMSAPVRRELAPVAAPPSQPDGRLFLAPVFRPPR
jgi:hypothetical protein